MSQFHVIAGAQEAPEPIAVRRIEVGDLYDCLRAGFEDFLHKPSHVMFIVILYPLIGVVLATWTAGANALPLLYPLVAGFALLGPLAALPLYEISRRRERGLDTSTAAILEFRRSPALPSVVAVGAWLMALFVAWLLAAQALYVTLIGAAAPASFGALLAQVLGTSQGWSLIVAGHAIGFAFAVVVLATTVIAFPLLVERDAGAWAAISTSFRAVAANPAVMAAWGLVVAVLLAAGSLPVFAGLIVVMPVLGHATWHLYRKMVEPPPDRA